MEATVGVCMAAPCMEAMEEACTVATGATVACTEEACILV